MSLRADLGPSVGSVDRARVAAGLVRPVGLREVLARYAVPIEFDEPLVTADGVALGGHHHVTLHRDGRFVHRGHARATGFPSFDYAVRSVIGGGAAEAIVAAQGRVHGTNEIGDRESAWNQEGRNNLLTLHWADLKTAPISTSFTHDTDIFGDVGDVLGFAALIAGGAVIGGPAGVAIALGIAVADLAGVDEELGIGGLVGLTLAAGILLVGGPAAIVPAVVAGIAAGAVAEAMVEDRGLTDEEFAFADRVFRGQLPRERVRLTNMLGLGGRPFTMPSLGDAILVNLGEGFADPVRYAGFGDPDNANRQAPGQLFVHELTHVWQIEHSTFLPGMMCEALVNQSTTISGDMGVYQYGPPDRAWADFNLEQQASIVDDWFAGSGRQAPPAGSPPAPASETGAYFRYIRDNIRTGITT
ncbi:hypothetical protein [Microbacterium sp. BK668]|uniref:hypothetical protein n=1 Tax=Microbacterium sp. BK668 TaxID=2512118 RepID=UPI001061B7B4|nr:hypothetical protein [Microbacterium sp. BK668]TDN88652.1 hypothetical protein EV279_3097 [Microbacterium sp. BK668]